MPQRQYMSSEQFSKLLRSLDGDQSQVDTSSMAILCPAAAEVKAIGGKDSRMIEFVITSDRIDREQDTLAADGWEFADFEANPVVLWAHDHYIPVIGNSRSLSRSGNKIRSIAEFTPKELNPFGYMIYRLYAEKFMHAVSVGFQPKEYTYAADRKYGINYLKQSLLEYSCVPVPANPDAVAVARSKGIDTAPLRDWAERVLDESRSGSSTLSPEARRRVEVLRAASTPSGRALILELGDMKMAGTEVEVPPTSTSVKRLDRWGCGVDAHVHESEKSAQQCAGFDQTVEEFVRSGEAVASLMTTYGRSLTDELKARVRATFESIVPVQQKEETDDTDEDDDDEEAGVLEVEDAPEDDQEQSFEISEESIRAAVSSAVDEKLREVTGRLD